MQMLGEVPLPVAEEVVRQQEEMGYPATIPAYGEYVAADGNHYFIHYNSVTVGTSEQIVEYHTRKARTSIKRWLRTRSATTRHTAAWHILRARIYRCRTISLTGQTGTTEADMPLSLEQCP